MAPGEALSAGRLVRSCSEWIRCAVMPLVQKMLKVVSLLNSHISELHICRPELAIYRYYCRVHVTYKAVVIPEHSDLLTVFNLYL
jgi:hypothetical protein